MASTETGRDIRDRTEDLMLPKHPLYHLSYVPKLWSPRQDSNLHLPPVTLLLIRIQGGYEGIKLGADIENRTRDYWVEASHVTSTPCPQYKLFGADGENRTLISGVALQHIPQTTTPA